MVSHVDMESQDFFEEKWQVPSERFDEHFWSLKVSQEGWRYIAVDMHESRTSGQDPMVLWVCRKIKHLGPAPPKKCRI